MRIERRVGSRRCDPTVLRGGGESTSRFLPARRCIRIRSRFVRNLFSPPIFPPTGGQTYPQGFSFRPQVMSSLSLHPHLRRGRNLLFLGSGLHGAPCCFRLCFIIAQLLPLMTVSASPHSHHHLGRSHTLYIKSTVFSVSYLMCRTYCSVQSDPLLSG